MEEGGSNSSSSNTAVPSTQQQHQHLLMQKQQQHQQQLYLIQQYQQQQHQQQQQLQHHHQNHHQNQQQQQQINLQQFQHLQQQQQQQQAISRFPSNIDAHLRAPGFRSLHLNNPHPNLQQPHHAPPQQQQQPLAHHPPPQPQQAKRPQPQPPSPEVEMAIQDALRVCNPDVKRPFASLEDAVVRLLPYHVVSDFEAEEDDRILDSDTTGQIASRLQQWDHNILTKIAEFTTTFDKQVLAFNIMSRKRAIGEFRSEERLMIEQALLQEEKQAVLEIRAEIESREKAGREAAEVKMRMAMAQAEHARVEAQAQARAEMLARAPMRASALGSHIDEGPGQDMGANQEEMMHGWGNAQRGEEEDPSEDFLNDDNEPENEEEAGMQEEWRDVGELDLNTR